MSPLRVKRMYLRLLKDVHSPFQLCNKSNVCWSCKSGIQNPALYSLSSVNIHCFSKSSRVLEGRPGLRSFLAFISSSSYRFRNLVNMSILPQWFEVPLSDLWTRACISSVARIPTAAFATPWKKAILVTTSHVSTCVVKWFQELSQSYAKFGWSWLLQQTACEVCLIAHSPVAVFVSLYCFREVCWFCLSSRFFSVLLLNS